MKLSTILKNHHKLPFNEINMNFHDESVVTGTVYFETPSIDDGSTYAHLFFGTKLIV